MRGRWSVIIRPMTLLLPWNGKEEKEDIRDRTFWKGCLLHQTIQHGELLATMIGFDYKEAAQSRGRAKLPFVSLSLLISLISSSPAEAGACE